MELELSGSVFEWRGPAPYHFVRVPDDVSDAIADIADEVSYGWGMIPVEATIGGTTWETSLWPKDGGYLLPVKDVVRRAEGVELDDDVHVRLRVKTRDGRLVHWAADDPRQPRNRWQQGH